MSNGIYNKITLNLSDITDFTECGTQGDYIVLSQADTNIDVFIKLNDTRSDSILLDTKDAISASGVDKFFVKAVSKVGNTSTSIEIVQSSNIGSFRLITSPRNIQLTNLGDQYKILSTLCYSFVNGDNRSFTYSTERK